MHARSLLPTIALALLAALPHATAAQRPPNVLLLMADDLAACLGCYRTSAPAQELAAKGGVSLVKTPNLDRFASSGLRFEHAYCQFPLCGPSRNSMLTGLYPNSEGILTNGLIFRQTVPSHVCMPQAFRTAGYFACRIGKLYHYNVPNSIGTNGHDDPGSWEVETNPAGCDRLQEEPNIFSLVPGQFGGTLSWYASPNPDQRHTDSLLADDAEWVLERCAKQKDRPFFLAVGFYRPHTPYVSPKHYFEQYPVEQMPVIQNIEEDRKDIPAAGLASKKREQDEMSDDLRRQAIQAYFASASFMDAQVGRVLAALERLGLAQNTIVVFTSDHGYHLGEHGLWQKLSLFEESTRVPLIIRAPGITSASQVAQSPVGLVDLYPTLAELCGVTTPPNLQGQSLVPMLRDPTDQGRGWTITQLSRGGGRAKAKGRPEVAQGLSGYSIRTPRWRYTEWGPDAAQGRELYDHDQDPLERTNLADQPAQAQAVAQLSAQLRTAAKATFPPSGKVPEIRPDIWAPNLTKP